MSPVQLKALPWEPDHKDIGELVRRFRVAQHAALGNNHSN